MKTPSLLILLSLILLLGSCQKLSELTQFEMEYNESVLIPKSTALSLPFNLMTPDVASNAESTFAVNDTRKDLKAVFFVDAKILGQ